MTIEDAAKQAADRLLLNRRASSIHTQEELEREIARAIREVVQS